MNGSAVLVCVIIGFLVGGLIWWVKRSILAAVLVPVVLMLVVAFAWPPADAPLTAIPEIVEPDQIATQDVNDDADLIAKLAEFRPAEIPDDGYVASDACRECHPHNHETWFASYHRTMTQVATPDVVLGDFDDVNLSHNGRKYQLDERDGMCWVEMLDPAAIPGSAEALQRVERPIVMTTGSHHMQAYWFPIGVGRTLAILPFVFLNETQEWIPRSAAFLGPTGDDVSHEIGRWNSACSQCHSTHRQEREVGVGEWDTRAAEFGISCEACHGPGEQHIAYQRDLAGNANTDASPSSDPIVNPESLSHVRSSQVCGQCHSVMTLKGDPDTVNFEGAAFRPGADLSQSHDLWQLHSPEMKELMNDTSIRERVIRTNRGTFYPDGQVRVSGREYTALEQSACFQQGEMSCLSCHQLHKSPDDPRSDREWADDQMKPDAYGNDACIQCHDQSQYSTQHTHHLAESSGSNCYNCHMPHTTYGLLKAIRNHTITSPDLKVDLAAKRPNACNQCHLDKTLKWTSDHLADWYSIDAPELDTEQSEIAASILWLLKGDAANRAIAAWTMGWSDAQAVSGDDWQSIYLAQLLNDPYLAVRMIARRSLKTLPNLADFKVDALGSDAERGQAILSIITNWDRDPHAANAALLLGPNNALKTSQLDAIMKQRDDTPMTLAE